MPARTLATHYRTANRVGLAHEKKLTIDNSSPMPRQLAKPIRRVFLDSLKPNLRAAAAAVSVVGVPRGG